MRPLQDVTGKGKPPSPQGLLVSPKPSPPLPPLPVSLPANLVRLCRPDPNESPYGRPDPALQSATNLIQSSDQDYEAVMKWVSTCNVFVA